MKKILIRTCCSLLIGCLAMDPAAAAVLAVPSIPSHVIQLSTAQTVFQQESLSAIDLAFSEHHHILQLVPIVSRVFRSEIKPPTQQLITPIKHITFYTDPQMKEHRSPLMFKSETEAATLLPDFDFEYWAVIKQYPERTEFYLYDSDVPNTVNLLFSFSIKWDSTRPLEVLLGAQERTELLEEKLGFNDFFGTAWIESNLEPWLASKGIGFLGSLGNAAWRQRLGMTERRNYYWFKPLIVQAKSSRFPEIEIQYGDPTSSALKRELAALGASEALGSEESRGFSTVYELLRNPDVTMDVVLEARNSENSLVGIRILYRQIHEWGWLDTPDGRDVVRSAYQHRGIGTRLRIESFRWMMRQGFKYFLATLENDIPYNRRALESAGKAVGAKVVQLDRSSHQFRVDFPADAIRISLHRLGRAA